MYGQGISYEGDVLDLAVSGDIVEKQEHGIRLRIQRLGKVEKTLKPILKKILKYWI
jgi:hypothetical protein